MLFFLSFTSYKYFIITIRDNSKITGNFEYSLLYDLSFILFVGAWRMEVQIDAENIILLE